MVMRSPGSERERIARLGRRWDDWRCYRCGRWWHAGEGKDEVREMSFGTITIRVCDPDCEPLGLGR